MNLAHDILLWIEARSLWSSAALLSATLSLYIAGLILYRLYLHPLSRYPGPFLARISNWHGVYYAWRGDKHLKIYSLHQTYGDFVRLSPNRVSISKSCAIKEIHGVGRNVQKSAEFYSTDMGRNTFNTIDKKVHSHKRKILARCFTDTALAQLEDSMITPIETFLQVISSNGKGTMENSTWKGDMGKWGNYLAFDIMGNLSFGKNFEMLTSTQTRHLPEVIDDFATRSYIATGSSWVRKLKLDRILCPGIQNAGQSLNEWVGHEVSNRKERDVDIHDFMSYIQTATEKDGTPSYTNFDEVVSEARLMVVAGSDTTATQIAANTFYIAQNENTQSKLYSEIRSTFNSVEEIRCGPQLESCKYLKAIVEETLRMSPSVPSVLPREVMTGGITVADEFFPEGVEISVPIYTLHHDLRYYHEPHKHIPERWLPEIAGDEAVNRCWSAFHPFSYGARQCAGKRMAYMELWITLARAIYLFEMEYVSGGREESFGPDVLEYRLQDHLTSARVGPVISFKKREV